MTEPSTYYRVWPDGTVQAVDDGPPYPWLSDDFMLLLAVSAEAAWDQFLLFEYVG